MHHVVVMKPDNVLLMTGKMFYLCLISMSRTLVTQIDINFDFATKRRTKRKLTDRFPDGGTGRLLYGVAVHLFLGSANSLLNRVALLLQDCVASVREIRQ